MYLCSDPSRGLWLDTYIPGHTMTHYQLPWRSESSDMVLLELIGCKWGVHMTQEALEREKVSWS